MKCASGCLLGMAFGDALGQKTEFLAIDDILERFPPNGPLEPEGDPALVTDDTQMALTVGEALLEAPRQRARASSPERFIARGWDECLGSLKALEAALTAWDRHGDPCRITGEGWIAEEAMATALLCFLLYPDDPTAAIQRAAVSSDDSDSIGCLTGAFAGAYHGMDTWPIDWVARIEYRERLAILGNTWD